MISDCLLLLDSIIMACDCLVLVSVGLVYLEGDVIGPIVAHPKPSYINKVKKASRNKMEMHMHCVTYLSFSLTISTIYFLIFHGGRDINGIRPGYATYLESGKVAFRW